MSLHVFVLEMKKLLGNLDGWLEKASQFAQAKKFEPDVFMLIRLAPDMRPLMFQVQNACDHAKYAAARTSGKEAPSNPDNEKTLADARQRIATTIAYLNTFTAADFEGAKDRRISLPRWEGKSMSAVDYLSEFAQPNFYFHVTTAYAILRHSGVDIGKRDYLGSLSMT
jgi:hypothetical protein